MKKDKRKKGLLVFFTADESEYLARLSKDTGYSRAALIRLRAFKPGWVNELWKLRERQGPLDG
jgi:hypothetical protein